MNFDQNLGTRDSLGARFFYARAPTSEPFSPNAANLPGWGTDQLHRNTMFVLAHTHSFSSNLANIARFGYMRYDGLSSVANPLTAQAIGKSARQPEPVGRAQMLLASPWATSLLEMLGRPVNGRLPILLSGRTRLRSPRDAIISVLERKFKRHQVDENQPQQTDGLLQISSFNDFLLGLSAAQNGSPTGTSNVTNSIAGSGNFRRDERYTNLAAFVQDDIKLASRLTINVGIRYEVFGAPTETNGRLPNFNALTAAGPVPVSGTYSGFTVPANFKGPVPTGVLKTPYAGFYKTPYGNISPRVGFVWQMTQAPTLLLRGGFGVYYDQHSGNLAEQTLSQLPFAASQFAFGSQNGAATLKSPFVPLALPPSSFPIFQPRTPDSFPFIEGTNPNLKDGRTYEYNLNIQHPFGRNLLSVGYVGTRSVNRPARLSSTRHCWPALNVPSMEKLLTPLIMRLRGCLFRGSARGLCLRTQCLRPTTTPCRSASLGRCRHACNSRQVTLGPRIWMK